MFSILKTAISRISTIMPKETSLKQCSALYHILTKPIQINCNTSIVNHDNLQLLIPTTPALMPSCGFKVKGRLKRRCKDCYFVVRQQRLYVICKTHPRHKQMSMVPREKNTWILTHATMGKVRPW